MVTSTQTEAMATAARWIESAQRVVAFSGAGLSAESGISTFRDTATDALWAHFDPMELASIEGFQRNPERVYRWYAWRRRQVAAAAPNPAHIILAQQHQWSHITQNVDNLLERAGLTSACIKLHGQLAKDRCHARCGYTEVIDLAAPPEQLRPCPQCGALLRPDVVWFGETLPNQAWEQAEAVVTNADLMLVIGTSASVYPAASLIPAAGYPTSDRTHPCRIINFNTEAATVAANHQLDITGPCGVTLPAILDAIAAG